MGPTVTREELVLGCAALAAVGAAGTLTYAALSSGSQLFGRTIIAGKNPDEVALTYDDGPNDAITEALLELLGRREVRATFFMIGRFVRQRGDLVRRVHAAGHLVGNHTATHPWLQGKTARVIREELRACNEALEDAIGEGIHYFRPPHGARRPFVLRAAAELGLQTVQWNILAGDWKPVGVAAIVARIDEGLAHCRAHGVGANIVLHDGGHTAIGASRGDSVQVTGQLLDRFSREGRRMVTVDAWSVGG